MKNDLFRKGLVYAIVILFIGVSIVPLTGIGAENHCLINDSIGYFNSIRESEERGVNVTLNGTMGENGWYISDVTITITWDPEEIAAVYYRLDDGGWILYTEPIVISEDGVHTFEWYCIDNEGNQSDVCGPFDLKIDQTPPTIELTVEKIGFRKWLITADVYDETSGIAKVEFYVNDEYLGEVTEAPYELVYTGTGYGLQIVVYDKAGNTAITCPVPRTRVFGIIPLTGSKSVEKTPVSDDTAYIGNFNEPTIVSISPSSQIVKPGEDFTVSVYVEPGEPIIGAGIQCLYFNASLIHANWVYWGEILNSCVLCDPGKIDNVAGTITDLYALVLPADAVNTSGSAFVIKFTAQQINGTSVLDLEGVSILNESGVTVPVVVYDGSVTVLDDTAPPEINNVTLTASNPLDTEPGFGWEAFTCIVTDNIAVDEVKLVLTGDTTTKYPMIKDGDEYYCNITISSADEYTYHIWADDANDNEITSNLQSFDIPTNWDVDMNGQAYFEDLIAIVMMYGDTGPGYPSPSSFGWVREDVNNDGVANFDDFFPSVLHYGEEW